MASLTKEHWLRMSDADRDKLIAEVTNGWRRNVSGELYDMIDDIVATRTRDVYRNVGLMGGPKRPVETVKYTRQFALTQPVLSRKGGNPLKQFVRYGSISVEIPSVAPPIVEAPRVSAP